MTIGMLALAGIPGTVGFIGKFQLIHALVNGAYTWLAIVLVVGSMISLGYYLRVIAVMWMRPVQAAPIPATGTGTPAGLAPIAGASPEVDELAETTGNAELALVGGVFAAAAVFFGIVPSPLFHFAAHAGHVFAGLF